MTPFDRVKAIHTLVRQLNPYDLGVVKIDDREMRLKDVLLSRLEQEMARERRMAQDFG